MVCLSTGKIPTITNVWSTPLPHQPLTTSLICFPMVEPLLRKHELADVSVKQLCRRLLDVPVARLNVVLLKKRCGKLWELMKRKERQARRQPVAKGSETALLLSANCRPQCNAGIFSARCVRACLSSKHYVCGGFVLRLGLLRKSGRHACCVLLQVRGSSSKACCCRRVSAS